jgi:hypothetical protein
MYIPILSFEHPVTYIIVILLISILYFIYYKVTKREKEPWEKQISELMKEKKTELKATKGYQKLLDDMRKTSYKVIKDTRMRSNLNEAHTYHPSNKEMEDYALSVFNTKKIKYKKGVNCKKIIPNFFPNGSCLVIDKNGSYIRKKAKYCSY